MPQSVRTADGVALPVHVEGPARPRSDGPPVVLVHGWSMSGRFFRRQVPDLAARRKVIVPDLRGRAVHRRRHSQGKAADLPELQPLPPLGGGRAFNHAVGSFLDDLR